MRRIATRVAKVGWADVGDESRFKALAQAFLDRHELAWQAVAGEHELAACLVQGIERVEELLLGLRLAGEELDVVDQQHVSVPVGVLEGVERARRERADEVIGEGLDGRVADGRATAERMHVVADRVEEVGLTEAWRGVQEQGVVGLAGELGDCERCRMREPVAVADDELVEAVARIELRRGLEFCVRPRPRLLAGCLGAGEADANGGTEHTARAGLDNPAEAFGDPRLGVRWCLQKEAGSVQRLDFDRSEPDLVGRLADHRAKLSADLAPGGGWLEMRGQLQATPSGSV